MVWGDYISLEYGKLVKDKESSDGTVPVYGTNGPIGTSHLPPLCKIPSFIVGRKGAYRGVHYSAVPFSVKSFRSLKMLPLQTPLSIPTGIWVQKSPSTALQ